MVAAWLETETGSVADVDDGVEPFYLVGGFGRAADDQHELGVCTLDAVCVEQSPVCYGRFDGGVEHDWKGGYEGVDR